MTAQEAGLGGFGMFGLTQEDSDASGLGRYGSRRSLPKPCEEYPGPCQRMSRIWPQSILTEALLCRLRRVTASLSMSNGDQRYDFSELAYEYGNETAVWWAWLLGFVVPSEGHYAITSRERKIEANHRRTVVDSWWGRRWFYHWMLAITHDPTVWTLVNHHVLSDWLVSQDEAEELLGADEKSNIGVRVRTSTTDEQRTLLQQKRCIYESYRTGLFAPLDVLQKPLGRPKGASKKLFVGSLLLYMQRHVKDLDFKRAFVDAAVPVAALWEPGNPGWIFRADQLTIWDALFRDGGWGNLGDRTIGRSRKALLWANSDAFYPSYVCDGEVVADGALQSEVVWDMLAEDIDADAPDADRSLYLAGNYCSPPHLEKSS